MGEEPRAGRVVQAHDLALDGVKRDPEARPECLRSHPPSPRRRSPPARRRSAPRRSSRTPASGAIRSGFQAGDLAPGPELHARAPAAPAPAPRSAAAGRLRGRRRPGGPRRTAGASAGSRRPGLAGAQTLDVEPEAAPGLEAHAPGPRPRRDPGPRPACRRPGSRGRSGPRPPQAPRRSPDTARRCADPSPSTPCSVRLASLTGREHPRRHPRGARARLAALEDDDAQTSLAGAPGDRQADHAATHDGHVK